MLIWLILRIIKLMYSHTYTYVHMCLYVYMCVCVQTHMCRLIKNHLLAPWHKSLFEVTPRIYILIKLLLYSRLLFLLFPL